MSAVINVPELDLSVLDAPDVPRAETGPDIVGGGMTPETGPGLDLSVLDEPEHDEQALPDPDDYIDENGVLTVPARDEERMTPDFALRLTRGKTPAYHAEILRLARRTGMAREVVEDDPEAARDAARLAVIKGDPTLAAWYGVPYNAGLGREDTKTLLQTMNAVRRVGSVTAYTPGMFDRLGILLREGGEQMQENLAGAVLMAAEKGGMDELAKTIRENLSVRERTGAAPLKGDSSLENYGYDFIRMVPQVAGQVGVAAGASVLGAGAAGAAAASMAFMGSQIAGGKYIPLTAQGVEPDRAFIASLADAGLQAPLEQIGLSKFMAIFKASGFGQIVKAAGESMATEFVTEWLQTYPEAATQLWGEAELKGRDLEESLACFFEDFWNYTMEGMYEGLVAAPFGLLGGAGRAMGIARQNRAARLFADAMNAEAHADALNNAMKIAAQSKTRELDADAFEALTRKATREGGELQYIDAEALRTFFQSRGEPLPAAAQAALAAREAEQAEVPSAPRFVKGEQAEVSSAPRFVGSPSKKGAGMEEN